MSFVLVIDDDPQFLTAAERLLVHAGYDVLLAASGGEGMEILDKRNQEISLAIVDLCLPGINGYELIGAITRRPNSIKIIATSSVFSDVHLEAAGSLGAHAVIRKPPLGQPLQEKNWLPTISKLVLARERPGKPLDHSAGSAQG